MPSAAPGCRGRRFAAMLMLTLAVAGGCASKRTVARPAAVPATTSSTAEPATTTAPAPATTVAEGPATTEHKHFDAYRGVQPSLPVSATLHGKCTVNASPVDPSRLDTWRCFSGNAVEDVCFERTGSDSMICVRKPWSTSATKVVLDEPPSDRGAITATDPWGLILANGEHCVSHGGTHDELNGVTEMQTCDHGNVYGKLDTSQPTWRARYAAKGARRFTTVDVVTEWK